MRHTAPAWPLAIALALLTRITWWAANRLGDKAQLGIIDGDNE